MFVSKDAPEDGPEYSIPVKKFVESEFDFINWMAHISAKPWFKPDKFSDLFRRLRSNALTEKDLSSSERDSFKSGPENYLIIFEI